jgi:hypothetical protein
LTTALDRKRRGDKSIWEWMEVFIVLFAIALFTIVFSVVQCCSQQQIESQRAQDAALQAYLDQMSRLLLEKDLRNSEEGSEVRTSPPSFLVATFCSGFSGGGLVCCVCRGSPRDRYGQRSQQ